MRPHMKLFRLLLLVTIAAGANTVRAQDDSIPLPPPVSSTGSGSGSITGRVVLPSGDPVNGRLRIILSTIENPGMLSYTDNNGGFGFRNLREGNYTLEVLADREVYEPISEQVRVNRGMQVVLLINLREKLTAAKKNIGAVVSAAEADPNVPEAARKEYEKGIRLAAHDRIPEAIERFKGAIVLYPKYLMAHNDLGVQYLKLKRTGEALEQFEAAIEINQKAFNPRLNIGIALVNQKRYTEAIDNLTQAISINSSSAAAHLYLGIAALETEDLATAVREIDAAQSLGGTEYAVAHYFRAHVAMKKGERELAITQLNAYLKTAPTGEYAPKARALLEELKRN